MLFALVTHELNNGYGIAIVDCIESDKFGANRWFVIFLIVARRFESVKHLDFANIL